MKFKCTLEKNDFWKLQKFCNSFYYFIVLSHTWKFAGYVFNWSVFIINCGVKIVKVIVPALQDWKAMYDVNVLGLLMCTREAHKIMEQAKVDDGHFIFMNSMAGHEVSIPVYSSTKFAVTALTEGLRKELREKKSHIRVTSISPGLIKTDFVTKFVYTDLHALVTDDLIYVYFIYVVCCTPFVYRF